eukprot:1374148-Amorphochlora_amoeboformis.AAC.2
MLKLCASNETGDSVPTYQNEEKKILGCKHYKRKCKLLCPDCNKLFTCRHCHAATEKHPFRRKQVSTMLCMCCSELQPVAQYCRKCKENMARYYCGTCMADTLLTRVAISLLRGWAAAESLMTTFIAITVAAVYRSISKPNTSAFGTRYRLTVQSAVITCSPQRN